VPTDLPLVLDDVDGHPRIVELPSHDRSRPAGADDEDRVRHAELPNPFAAARRPRYRRGRAHPPAKLHVHLDHAVRTAAWCNRIPEHRPRAPHEDGDNGRRARSSTPSPRIVDDDDQIRSRLRRVLSVEGRCRGGRP
jgi:hypothetical protein